MHRFLILGAFALSTVLITPVVAQRADDNNHQGKRYYDKSGKDYHTWDNNENRAYRTYLGQQHRDYSDFNRNKRVQQQQYFTWRHQNPDSALFKVEIR
jgi:hypothetical protein